MKTKLNLVFAGLFLAGMASAFAAARYVDANSTNATPPFTNWSTAATVIQDAVDVAAAGDEIVVTNGIYATGGRPAGTNSVGTNLLANRVAVDKPLTVRSVNGPQFTVIQGYQVPGTTNGDGAIRCVYLTNGASLSGFTLTKGATREWTDYVDEPDASGGGLWCESTAVVSNCVVTGNSAGYEGGGTYSGTLNNCTLAGNSADGNYAFGGGAYEGTLNNCRLTANRASNSGGGSHGSTLNNCTLTGNSAGFLGGGSHWSTLNNSTLTGNSAGCGGGVCNCTLNNCTLTGNSAVSGGGACGFDLAACWLNNCIVYYNTAASGDENCGPQCVLNYCCTAPLAASGTGNISDDPQLASTSHLNATSPCRGAGSADYVTGTDIDGEAWASPPSMGCDEYRAGAVTGPLAVGLVATLTNLAVGYPVDLTAVIEGRTTGSVWDFGDGVVTSNRPYATHAWATPGDYVVALRAFNESHPSGVSGTLTVHVVAQPVHYVAIGSPNPLVPYTSWDTAARNIQDAVDTVDSTEVPGTLVLVTNGVYANGGRSVYGTMTNRVVVDKPVVVRSVNGPEFTLIQGRQVPGSTNGDGAIRCVYLTNGARLCGFTLTSGATREWTGDEREENGGGLWCESATAVVSNCVVAGNSAYYSGGGAVWGTLNNCTLTGNSAYFGGGAYESRLYNCILTGNSAGYEGGGAHSGTLNNCAITDNSAFGGANGGGAAWATINNCNLNGNSAESGGGAYYSTLNNCRLAGNSADSGGGGYGGTMNNCTLTGNSSSGYGASGGGAINATLNNCIVYFNTAAFGSNYDSSSSLNYCCTAPLPPDGIGNIASDPQLASPSHLSVSSPCRGAGSAAYATGTDIDGEGWATPPSIGCDEYHAGAVTGSLSVAVVAAYTNVAVGYPVALTAVVEGRATASVWEFGDGLVASNWPYATHAWTASGDYLVVLRAYNESQAGGVSATVTLHVVAQPVHYVAADSANPVAPYTSWATAARTIQEAVDAGVVGGTVLVTNGTYATGGRVVQGTMTNRVAVHKPLTVRSVNGPQLTVIKGYQVPDTVIGDGAIRCVYLTDGASLSGFTLTSGATRGWDGNRERFGGGVWCESASAVVSNCVVAGNWGFYCGGVYGGTLNNCTLEGNMAQIGGEAWMDGGGAYYGTLNNCILRDNGASDGGGAYEATLNNCTLANNSAVDGGGAYGGTLNNCTLIGNIASYGGGTYYSTLNNCTLTYNYGCVGGGAYGGTLNNSALNCNEAGCGVGGGGAYGATLNNCTLAGNTADAYYSGYYGSGSGGGARESTLNNCTLTGNSALSGGGAYAAALNNCIVYFNTSTNGANYSGGAVNYCCTTPMPTNGVGNITNTPLFVDYAGRNLRLQSNSPCINAGLNAYAPGPTDLDGNPRIVSGTVDIGAYEFQGPGSVISYAWLQHYGLPTDGSADFVDTDGDGMNNWQEWVCATCPTNTLSALRLLSPSITGTSATLTWQSVAGVNYFLERSTNLASWPPFSLLATNIVGKAVTTTCTDTSSTSAGPFFYRVGVTPP